MFVFGEEVMMKIVLLPAVLVLTSIASANYCTDAVLQALVVDVSMNSFGGAKLDSSYTMDNLNDADTPEGGRQTYQKYHWEENLVISVDNESFSKGSGTEKENFKLTYLENESLVSDSGTEIVGEMTTSGDTSVYHYSLYIDGKSSASRSVKFFKTGFFFESVDSRGSVSGNEAVMRNDTLFSWRLYRNEMAETTDTSIYIYYVQNSDDSTKCTQWVKYYDETVANMSREYEVVENEQGYVLVQTTIVSAKDAAAGYSRVNKGFWIVDNGKEGNVVEPPKDTSVVDSTVIPQDTVPTPKDTTQAIVKQMRAVPVLKPRDHYIDLKGRRFSNQKKQLPYRVLF